MQALAYKSLCAAVTICATIVHPKLAFTLWPQPPGHSKSRSNWGESVSWCNRVRCTCCAKLV